MKKISKITYFAGVKVAMLIAVFAVSPQAMTADWTINQTSTTNGTDPVLRQGDAGVVTNSTQALNGVALSRTEDSVATSSSQVATLTPSDTFTMDQGPMIIGSTQALNSIEAQNIGSVAGAGVTQIMTSSGALVMNQTAASPGGDGNLQAINAADVADKINELAQIINKSDTFTMNQTPSTSSNIQALNYAKAHTIGASDADLLLQNIGVSGPSIITQSTTGTASTNIQAFNFADANSADASASAGEPEIIHLSQSTALNAPSITFISNNQSGTSGNTQAINLARGEKIDGTTQTILNTTSGETRFEMTGISSNGNTQAGNMAVTNGVAAQIIFINQEFITSTSNVTFLQASNSSNLIQAGNLIDLGQGGMADLGQDPSGDDIPHQIFEHTDGAFLMTQTSSGGAISNLQALNAVVDAPGGTSAVYIRQTFESLAGTFVMSQNSVSTAGQFGNFAGAKY